MCAEMSLTQSSRPTCTCRASLCSCQVSLLAVPAWRCACLPVRSPAPRGTAMACMGRMAGCTGCLPVRRVPAAACNLLAEPCWDTLSPSAIHAAFACPCLPAQLQYRRCKALFLECSTALQKRICPLQKWAGACGQQTQQHTCCCCLCKSVSQALLRQQATLHSNSRASTLYPGLPAGSQLQGFEGPAVTSSALPCLQRPLSGAFDVLL